MKERYIDYIDKSLTDRPGDSVLYQFKRKILDEMTAMDSTVEALDQADGQLTGIQVKNKITGETTALAVDNLFVAVGRQPQNQLFADLVELDEAGYIRSSDCRTSRPGVYAAGDCRTKDVRQLTTAVSDGTVAALLFLEET